jgi:hypothetical protein
MSIIYYSNYCEPSKKLLQKIAKTKLNKEIHFICIDKRKRDSKGNMIIFVENEQIMLPSSVTKVPALYLMETKQVMFGDDIYAQLLPKEVAINQEATAGNGEPECYSIFGMNKISDSYSYWDQSADELTAKGKGGMRQMHQFAPIEDQYKINTPNEDYVADKVGKSGKTLDEYKAERDSLVPSVQRI